MFYINSEKKKSVFVGGGPATSPLGISTISPDRSEKGTTMSGRRDEPDLIKTHPRV